MEGDMEETWECLDAVGPVCEQGTGTISPTQAPQL